MYIRPEHSQSLPPPGAPVERHESMLHLYQALSMTSTVWAFVEEMSLILRSNQ